MIQRHKIGTIVAIDGYAGLGVIDSVKTHWRASRPYRPIAKIFARVAWYDDDVVSHALYRVRYINSETGKLLVCPDRRCRGENVACPICSRHAWHEQLTPLSERDMAFYVAEGLIDQSLTASTSQDQSLRS
jgi:hypothetical protein